MIPAEQLRLHFGELNQEEVALVRAAIGFAHSLPRVVSHDELETAHIAQCKAMGINPESSLIMKEALAQALETLRIGVEK